MTHLQFERWREFSTRMAKGYPSVTDARRKLIVEYVDHFLSCAEDEYELYDSWDQGPGYLCDRFSEWSDCLPGYWRLSDWKYQNWKFRNQVCACIRAGIDVAVEPSAGVLGFTAGHVRAWFDGQVPSWVKEFFAEGEFDRAPDQARIWL